MKLIETEVREFMYHPRGYGYLGNLRPLFISLPWVGAHYILISYSTLMESRAEAGPVHTELPSEEEKEGFREIS